MSLHTPRDVKNHPSPPCRTKLHLCEPLPNAARLSGDKPDASNEVRLGFAEDFLAEHSDTRTAAPAGLMTGSISAQAGAAAEIARA